MELLLFLHRLYGYTSNENGIRYSLMEDPDIQYEDANFIF